jgi:hypothetical protein
MSDLLNVAVADGKYTFVQHADGKFELLRYGEQWRSLIGDNAVLALAQTAENLRDEVQRLREALGHASTDAHPIGCITIAHGDEPPCGVCLGCRARAALRDRDRLEKAVRAYVACPSCLGSKSEECVHCKGSGLDPNGPRMLLEAL